MNTTYLRTWALDDIQISRAHTDGRTVEAYAAIFGQPAEIRDQHGHYMEVIDRAAFNRQIGLGVGHVQVYYNHGYTLHGTPSELGSVPIGTPLEIRADSRGLRTVTRYNNSQLADAALEAIRAGDIPGYSFRGRIYKSTPDRVPKTRGGDLPTVTRTELGLTEYGPTPTPAYAGAGILAVRSLAAGLAALAADERAELIRVLSSTTPLQDQDDDAATPDLGPGTEDEPLTRHSGRIAVARAQARIELSRMGAK
jgi:HK97 family phage prohead protease